MKQSIKSTLSKVMTLAWQFVKKNGYSMSEALHTAWLNVKNIKNLAKGITHFYFKKIDGSIREAWGTIKENLIPEVTNERKANPTTQTYYDTEKEQWRCYKKANLYRIA